jgi:geranylgeranyl reductase family protein
VNFLFDTHYDADVLIAGGGPAGASCAWHLAKRGHKVLLVDFQRFPRDKVCGDFVGPVAIRELEAMGITSYEQFQNANVIRKATVFLDGEPLVTKPIPHVANLPDHGRVIPRQILDNWIYEAAKNAGVKMLAPCRLNNFEVHENGVVSFCKMGNKEISFTTKFLVGADGSSSTTARIVNGAKPDPKDRIVAVRAYYENINCVPEQAELYFTSKSFPGYYWFFPTGSKSANAGVGMVLDNFPKDDINLKELLMDLIASDKTLNEKIGDGVLKDKVVGWPLSTYNPDAKIVMQRVLLAGDAAGLINSLNGEGIQYAMLSGRWAAECLSTCFATNDFSLKAIEKYEHKVKSEVGYDMCLSNMVIQFIRNKNLNPLWLKLLELMSKRAINDENYARVAGGILAGLVPANEAVTFSFLGKSVMEGMAAIAHSTANVARKGPVGISAFGIQAAGFALAQLSGLMQQPVEYWKWTKGLADNGLTLSGYIMKDIKERLVG